MVIPMLQSFVVDAHWLTDREFLIGLAIINSMPGPNFNIAAFCGALAFRDSPFMFAGGLLGSIGIFTPGILLMSSLITLWKRFRRLSNVQLFLKGVNASAIGLVFAATYILSMKSIVSIKDGNSSSVDPLVLYPLYTAVAGLTFAFVGFLDIPAPFGVFFGGTIGFLDWKFRSFT